MTKDEAFLFYVSKEWRRLRKQILRDDKAECFHCRAKGFYSKANTVHHINYLRIHPELALSRMYVDDEGITKRNLICVCRECHETVCHPERLRKAKEQLNEEKW